MSCIDYDIKQQLSQHVTNNRIPGLDYDMIYYANDTILFSQSSRGTNELIKLTEETSNKYGLNLNKGKCAAICMNNNNDTNIHLQNNEQL
jgi:hypothetical protein